MQPKLIPKQVFLSQPKNDKDLKILAKALSLELQKRGYKVWLNDYIQPGSDWSSEIAVALNESDAMVALLNQYSFSSSYVRDGLEYAFFNEQYKNRVLPVLIGSSSEGDFSRLPWMLTKMSYLTISDLNLPEDLAITIADRFDKLLAGRGNEHAA